MNKREIAEARDKVVRKQMGLPQRHEYVGARKLRSTPPPCYKMGQCKGCGCPYEQETLGCVNCKSRHKGRRGRSDSSSSPL